MSEIITIGDMIDKIPIEDIIRREDFVKLEVFRRFDKITGLPVSSNDYWEITFESNERGNDGLYIFNKSKSPYKYFKVFKLKV